LLYSHRQLVDVDLSLPNLPSSEVLILKCRSHFLRGIARKCIIEAGARHTPNDRDKLGSLLGSDSGTQFASD
jgi:hypothetical protein